jgi:hypothetical protein
MSRSSSGGRTRAARVRRPRERSWRGMRHGAGASGSRPRRAWAASGRIRRSHSRSSGAVSAPPGSGWCGERARALRTPKGGQRVCRVWIAAPACAQRSRRRQSLWLRGPCHPGPTIRGPPATTTASALNRARPQRRGCDAHRLRIAVEARQDADRRISDRRLRDVNAIG